MIQIVTGIVFIMLLFSLLATTVMELLAGLLSLRGKQLIEALSSMLGNKMDDFTGHPFFRQLTISGGGKDKKSSPSYLNSGTFGSILFDVMDINTIEEAETRINQLSNNHLKKILLFLLRQSGGNILIFRQKVEDWFNEVMDRATGWYKRKAQWWLFLIGVGIALLFNADAVNIYNNLSINSSLRDFVATAATNYVNSGQAPSTATTGMTGTMEVSEARKQINTLVTENISVLESPLGLGWSSVDWSKADFSFWLYKIVGWFVTALAVSLGAPFWFDLLKKIVNVRSSGPPPPAAAPAVYQLPPADKHTGNYLTQAKSDDNSPFESSRSAKKPPKTTKKDDPKT